MPSLNEIRATYLDYFAADGHAKVHSAPLVPQNDPSLLFVNAGMVPFKDYFTGAAKPPYPRATSSQKCVRAGGKHNDLDNVGYTARHLTFFEMLGNFSFGDYFKEHAIDRAWKLVTQEFGLDAKRLLVTVYIDDDEAAAIWKKVTGFSDDKIIRIAGVTVEPVSGEWQGVQAPIQSLIDIHLAVVRLPGGATFETPVGPGRNVFLYVVKGEVSVAGTGVPQWNLAALGDGDAVEITAASDAVVLLGHAEPIGEPVFSHGPFVMNTREEIIQAVQDYQSGKFGAPPRV